MKKDYEDESRGIRIDFLGNRFKLTTKEEHKEYYKNETKRLGCKFCVFQSSILSLKRFIELADVISWSREQFII